MMTLTNKQAERLRRIARYRTAYELAITNNTDTYLVRYSASKSRRSLLANCRFSADQLVSLTGSEEITWGNRAADGAVMGDWRITWTGRTEREAIIEGEHPFIHTS
mgnify:CR=1 FL=1